ncbi:hypothetical protein E4U60_001375 [Claviceps pazoutovae]|uniref:SHSP domain-containing protein n=1 Tax=Claviceps pazoutovae TaxID=1649127 RepID=A0A9P7MCR9_9HYPO|nr:hypothetical protein E4U60_001375 [Claviceps pazoutovae]
MAFFPQALYSQDRSSFTPLFRLLDDFDSYSQGNATTKSQSNRTGSLPTWQPSFDLRETADRYELYGDLPGVNKEHVTIDFTEPQTLQIRGKSERRYHAGTPCTRQIENTATSGASHSEKATMPRQATVEDEDDEEWSHGGHSAPGTPASTTVEIERPAQVQKPADNAKYWLAERKFGEFSRSFNFPNRVDQDGVLASFQDGVLSVIVPKAKKHEARRIIIS